MSSQFFGLEIGHTGLTAFQAAINTTANNISNVETPGYSKQKVNLEAQSALRVYQKYGSTSTGVIPQDITRSRDLYYDQKYWANQANYGYYDKLDYYMPQIEEYFIDNAANPGFSSLFSDMFNTLNALKSDAGNTAIRAQAVSEAQKLTNYFNNTANQLATLQETVNDEIKSTVDNINSIAKKISLLNKQINTIEIAGGTANDLRDSRDLLIDELSAIVTVDTSEAKVVNSNYPDMQTGATSFTVKIDGQILVKDNDYFEMECVTRKEPYNQSDVDGLYDVQWKNTQAKINFQSYSLSGSLKALFMVRDGNDEENLKGILDASSSPSQIVMSSPSITDINSMNLPPAGQITINNANYNYDSITFTTDENGNVRSYTFNLSHAIDQAQITKASGQRIYVGETVNYKGIPYYQNQMNSFVRNFAKAMNDMQLAGRDRNGDMGQVLFAAKDEEYGERHFDYDVTAGTSTKTTDNGYCKEVTNDSKYKPYYKTYYLNAAGEKVLAAADGDKDKDLYRVATGDDDTYYRLTAKNININDAVNRDASLFSTTSYYELSDDWDGRNPYDVDPDDTESYSKVFKVKDGKLTKLEKGIASADLMDDILKLQSEKKLFRGGGADDFLQVIYADITVDTQEASVFADNYLSIQAEIDRQRQSVSGVDEDEEALNLVKFQNAYNLSAKVISVLKEMYDQLILSTGV